MKLWSIPSVYTAGSVVAAIVVPRLESAVMPGFTHAMSVASATAFLTATASGILAFTAIVFSIAFVMVQFSAIAYSPRLVLWFANQPALYHALGIFIATFTYAMATLLWTDRGGNGDVPFVSTMIVIVLLVASMAAFSRLVQGLGNLQITEVLSMIGRQGRLVIAEQDKLHGAAATSDGSVVLAPSALWGPAKLVAHVGEPRCVTRIEARRLAQAADAADGVVILVAAVGDTLVEGSTILEVYRAPPTADLDALRACVHLGPERTFEQDPKYAIRLLVDIAIKALSPAINDPTTAVQALDQIEDLLRRISGQALGSIWLEGANGQSRLFVPLPDWDDYLSLAFDEIRQYGLTSIQVMRRLRAALVGLEQILKGTDRAASVTRYLAHLDGAIAASDLDSLDRTTAQQMDRQGLGFTRDIVADTGGGRG